MALISCVVTPATVSGKVSHRAQPFSAGSRCSVSSISRRFNRRHSQIHQFIKLSIHQIMEEKLFARIVALLTAHFDNMPAAEDIHLDDNLHEDLNLDSIDIVDFIMMCETNFNIKLDMTDAKNTHTLRDLIRSIIEVKPSLCDAQ